MTKEHSVNVSFEKKDYDALTKLAKEQDRYINAQARHMLRKALADKQAAVGPLQAPVGGSFEIVSPESLHTDSAPSVPSATYVERDPIPG